MWKREWKSVYNRGIRESETNWGLDQWIKLLQYIIFIFIRGGEFKNVKNVCWILLREVINVRGYQKSKKFFMWKINN